MGLVSLVDNVGITCGEDSSWDRTLNLVFLVLFPKSLLLSPRVDWAHLYFRSHIRRTRIDVLDKRLESIYIG